MRPPSGTTSSRGREHVRRHLETFVLIIVAATVVAFGISFAVGLGGRAGGRAGYDPFRSTGVDSSRVRVEVLNGAGRPGLAERVTDRLRARGFDVVYFGNAANFDWERSVVYARTADTLRARSVAEALAIGRVESRPDPDLHLDVTVVLGREWTPPAAPPRSRVRGWLDAVRRWLGARDGEAAESRR